MKIKHYATLLAIALSVLMIFFADPVICQEKKSDTMQILREELQGDKKHLVAETIKFTEPEAKDF